MEWLESALVGLDLGRVSESFASWLPGLRAVGVRRLYLLHVIPVESVEHVIGGYPVDRLVDELARSAREALERHAEALRAAGFEVEVLDPPVGEPAALIVEKAGEAGAGFIALASRGHGLLRRILLGSTVEEVVNSSDRPVLIARVSGEGGEPRIQGPLTGGPILAAVALDDYAAEVAGKAGDLALRAGVKVVLAHVIEEGEDDRRVHELLDELASRLEARGVRVEERILGGRPAKELTRLAGEYGASLVVAGRASTPQGHAGSVAEHLARRSPTHVLVVCRPGL